MKENSLPPTALPKALSLTEYHYQPSDSFNRELHTKIPF